MKIATFFLLLIFPLFCNAQLKGIVKNHQNPIPFANIILSDFEGNFIAETTTLEDGSFELLIKNGSYNLKISSVGFTDFEKEISIQGTLDLGIIQLLESATNLDEVFIESNKKTVEQKIDKVVYNIENKISNSGGDALTALKTAPGVLVQNNSINILGKGSSRVMIDGRIIELSGEDLNNFLKSIASADIKNIEIITNPSAKHDANGDGGLININLKKAKKDSWKNTTSLIYEQNKYGASTLRNSFSYSKNKFRLSASGNGKIGNSQEKETLDINYPDGLWQLKNESKIKEDNISGRISVDYDISEATTFGFQYLGSSTNPDRKSDTKIAIYDTNNALESILKNNGYNDQDAKNNSFNAHFATKLDTLGKNLSVDVDYFTFDSKFDNNFLAQTFSPDMTFVEVNQSAKNTSAQGIDNFSIKADFEQPLKTINLSYGAKASFIKSNSNLQYFNTISKNPELDASQSNRFHYKENNQSVYINGNKKFNEKLQIQLGLRIENTQTNGFSETLNQEINNDYLKIFPKFYISYQLNDDQNLNFNYGKRINRPGFSLLNPFRSYINSNSYSEGNPFLKPSFSDNFDFTFSYKEKFRTNAFLNYTSQGYGVIFTSDASTNTQIITRQNYYNEYYYGLGENFSGEITKWWENESSLYLFGSKTNFTTNLEAKLENTVQVYLTTNNIFSVNETTKIEVDYSYSSSVKKGLYEIGYMSGLSIGLQKSILKNSVQVSLLANDIFNTSYLKNYKSTVNGIDQNYSENNSSRFVRLSLTYNFGNKKLNLKPHESGNEEEKRRALKK